MQIAMRWSVRTSCVVVALIGLALSMAVQARQREFDRERAIAEIAKRGGHINCNWDDCAKEDGTEAALRPVTNLFWAGEDVTDVGLGPVAQLIDLKRLSLSYSAITDTGMAHLAGLFRLEILDLRETAITDVGLAQLAGLVHLTELNLWQTKVRGPGLDSLRLLPGLRSLNLIDTPMTDEGMVYVGHLSSLYTVTLPEGITDAGLIHLRGLTNLREVCLLYTYVLGPGLVHLTNLPNLERLVFIGNLIDEESLIPLASFHRLKAFDISGSMLGRGLGDQGLERLGPLASIEELDLDRTSITDASLPILKRFPRLKTLYIRDTKLSNGGIDELHRAMPALTIYGSAAPRDR